MKRVLALLALLLPLVAVPLFAQHALLYPVPLAERIDAASVIVEGRVVAQEAFWNEAHTLIHTAHTVEVYRVFKGEVRADHIEVVTPGGQIGFQANVVEPSLRLRLGAVGMFFAEPARERGSSTDVDRALVFQPYASVQGFARYDEIQGLAHDVFNTYRDIEKELYDAIGRRTGQPLQVRQDYRTPGTAASTAAKGASVVVITSFSPNPIDAGTDEVLTINGSGFEAYDGGINSFVFFPNADDGGATLLSTPASEILSWNDTQITLNQPSDTGTGTFLVQSASSLQGSSSTPLTVDFSHTNVSFGGAFHVVSLQDKNGSGGYTLVQSTATTDNGVDFSTGSGADPFGRALSTWQQGTGFNVVVSGTTSSNTVDANTDPDIVMFDNDGTPRPSGVLGTAFSGFRSCDGTTWFLDGFDIVFRRDGTDGVTWNFGPGGTGFSDFDFESVALHELGHAHQLGHIIASGNVMHFSLSNGSDIRTLDTTSDVGGGNFVRNQSLSLNTCSGTVTGMTTFLPVELVAFDAQVDGTEVVLAWQTATETNNAGFEVQHQPAAGEGWHALGFVDGKGTTTLPQTYRHSVDGLGAGRHTFRLKQVDFDGTAAYSPEVEVLLTVPGAYALSTVYPNPFGSSTTLTVAVGQAQHVEVAVFDLLGRRVATLHEGPMMADDTRTLRWQADAVAPGTYFVRFTGETFHAVRTVVRR